jgi:hypothetical protein
MKGWKLKKQEPDWVEGRYFPLMERITKLEEAMQEGLKKRDEKIAELHYGLSNLRGAVAREVANQLAKGTDTQVQERVDDLDDRLLTLEKAFDDFREVTDRNVKLLDQIVYKHEVNLNEHTETLAQLAKTPQPIENRFDFSEGRPYSTLMTQLLEQAWKKVNDLTLIDPFSHWLTNEQRSLLPFQFDVIAAVYLFTNGAPEYAHSSRLASQIGWLKKGEVSQIASFLVAKGYLAERRLTKDEWFSPGSVPHVFRLTDRILNLLFGLGTSNMEGGSVHKAMQLATFRDAISASPPMLYLAIPQVPGESRSDGVLVERVDSKCWDWRNACAVNIETDEEIRAHSSTKPDSEGETYLNLVRPFTQGCKCLIVVCLQDKAETLTKLVNELPTWLQKRIHVKVVYV